MKTALHSALGLLLLAGFFAPAALAEIQPEVSYAYYQVPYLPGRPVTELIARSTPLGGGLTHSNFAVAHWQIRFDGLTLVRPKIDVCRVEEPRVTCRCEITMPQLQGGDEKLRRDFEKVAAAIREHELEHCRLAARYADKLEQAFRALPERDCDEIGPALVEIYKKTHDDCSVAQKRFDYDAYGYDQYRYVQALQALADAGFKVAPPREGRRQARPAPQGQPTMTVLPQDKEELKREGIYQDENGVWRNY